MLRDDTIVAKTYVVTLVGVDGCGCCWMGRKPGDNVYYSTFPHELHCNDRGTGAIEWPYEVAMADGFAFSAAVVGYLVGFWRRTLR